MSKTKEMSVQTLVMGAVLTALVIVLQFMGSFIKFGPFSISLVLIPIVIGTATCGKGIGAWLGFVFGAVVLLSGDAAVFLTVNVWGTVLIVLLKGIGCGFVSGLAYEGTKKLSGGKDYLSTMVAAFVCPLVNTGIFVIGCYLFFMDTIAGWAAAAGAGGNITNFIIVGIVGTNFLVELAVNVVFSPIIVRIIKAVKKA